MGNVTVHTEYCESQGKYFNKYVTQNINIIIMLYNFMQSDYKREIIINNNNYYYFI